MKLYFAADHAGFELKAVLMQHAKLLHHEVYDCGAYELDNVDDYPEIIGRAGHLLSVDVEAKLESRAIVIGASGQGEAIVMNRYHGVRCALYYGPAGKSQTDMSGKNLDLLTSTREHNNANALSLAARFLTEEQAKEAMSKWLATPFSGDERHVRRIQKLETTG